MTYLNVLKHIRKRSEALRVSRGQIGLCFVVQSSTSYQHILLVLMATISDMGFMETAAPAKEVVPSGLLPCPTSGLELMGQNAYKSYPMSNGQIRECKKVGHPKSRN